MRHVEACSRESVGVMEARLRLAVETAERHRLSEVAALVWRALSESAITEIEAEALSLLIEARKAPEGAVSSMRILKPSRGSRPRTSESMARRRRWAASGRLPPQIACQFTQGEQAALAVLSFQVEKSGRCDLAVGHIAALAGVSETTVRRALREAKRLGLIRVTERRVSRFRSQTNLVTILDRGWLRWVELRQPAHKGGGCQSWKATNTSDLYRNRRSHRNSMIEVSGVTQLRPEPRRPPARAKIKSATMDQSLVDGEKSCSSRGFTKALVETIWPSICN